MLNERLIMARQLLKEEGVIFVSIDDNEQAYLKVLMDEIFGEENFLNILVWISNKKGRQISKSQYSKIYEYILVYAKDIKKLDVNFNKSRDDLNKLMPEFYNNDDDEIKVDENGEFLLLNEFHNTNINAFNIDTRRNLFYPIFVNEQEISTVPGEGLIRILPPKNKEGTQAVWRWEKDKLEKEKHNLYVEKLGDKLKILTKKRDITFKIKDVLLNSNMTTRSGTIELDNVIKGSQFKTVKPTSLIKFLINISNNKNARILDFYAGSGTTGHAVMELNREDGGNRSYTLVTNNENNIGIDVCYERLYRINKGISINGDSNFAWIKKNEPYQSNLNVFNLEYFDTSIFNESDSNEKIKDIFIKELIDFGINKENIDNLEILRDLTSLKPISKENNDASN
ncbi:type III restriction enzyme/adenine-specific DNA-methyltransferase [Metamycoplasma auris]|uniref:Type III restriction enzyme/adenine-specific DNA-methyltransferase n=2 Tax=Metamycoplasma auris TaxID=51363 RepID=A0A2W7FZS5_9BACT|nr:type III restriction enzyme/adenine-specific DNA-methyltransferase [Metamycoplasma auris]